MQNGLETYTKKGDFITWGMYDQLTSENREKKEQLVLATTLLWDDETKEIISTEFAFELL